MGTITHGNISGDTVHYSNEEETIGCPVASIVLPSFVDPVAKTFSFATLMAVVRHVVLALTRIVMQSRPPIAGARTAMWNNRSISIGIQGLADALVMMGIPYDSEHAYRFNSELSETIYYSAVNASCDLIERFGAHPTFNDTLAARGIFQFDRWETPLFSGRFDWAALRKKMARGMTNSLLVAFAPTHATSHITGCSEGLEPYFR